jgi:type IV pilus assembly protein PilA
MKKMQQGFTLIELMIVVAIIGILAAIAIPQYQDYVTRSKWQGATTTLETLKTSLAECAQNHAGSFLLCDYGTVPDSNGISAAPTPPAPITLSALALGATTVSMVLTDPGTTMGGCTVTILGTTTETAVTWLYTTGGGCTKRKTGY